MKGISDLIYIGNWNRKKPGDRLSGKHVDSSRLVVPFSGKVGLSKTNRRNFPTKFCNLLIIYFLFSGIYASSQAANPDIQSIGEFISRGIEYTLNNDFRRAEEIYNRLIAQYPHHPIGYFYKSATLQAEMLDAEDYARKEEFYRLIDQTLAAADSLKADQSQDAWFWFYEGSAYLYRSFMKSKESKWFAAFSDAKKGVGHLERALAIDSSLYDAYLGIGSFKYWKSARAKFLLWLPFISDERQEGIQMVRESITKGKFTYWIGRDQLSWILMDAGHCEEALAIARENLAAHPQSRFFKWTLVEAAYKCQKFDLCLQIYQELLREIQQIPQNNHYNEVECLLRISEIFADRGEWQNAYHFADTALKLNLDEAIRERVKHKLSQALKIRNEAQKHIN
ncbi:MAG: hypothetical protein Kow0042_27800 [Calditrichia bacterium]